MIIMRSDINMKDKLVKRRVHIQWNEVRNNLEDLRVNVYFMKLRQTLRYMSENRLSYLALLHFYDKKVLDYYRLTKDMSIFTKFDLRNYPDFYEEVFCK